MEVVALMLVIVFALLLVSNTPIAVAIALATFLAIFVEGSDPSIVVASKMANGVNSFALLAIPFFILSGHLMGKGGMMGMGGKMGYGKGKGYYGKGYYGKGGYGYYDGTFVCYAHPLMVYMTFVSMFYVYLLDSKVSCKSSSILD